MSARMKIAAPGTRRPLRSRIRRVSMMARQRNRTIQSKILRGVPGPVWTQRLATGTEVKGLDTAINSPTFVGITSATNSSAGVGVLNLIQPGSGSWNRIGRKTFPRSLRMKYTIRYVYTHRAADGLFASSLRMLLVWDKNPNAGALPLFDTMFKQTDQNGAEVSLWNSPAAFDTMDRFRVIRDKVIDVNPDVYPDPVGGLSFWEKNFDEFIALPEGLETVYSGQATPQTIADIYSGALYLVVIIKDTLPSGYGISIEPGSVARLRYTD